MTPWCAVGWPRSRAIESLPPTPSGAVAAAFGLRLDATIDPEPIAVGSNSANWVVTDSAGARWNLRCALGNRDVHALEAMAEIADGLTAAGVFTKTARRTADGRACALDDRARPWQCWRWIAGHSPSTSASGAQAIGWATRLLHTTLDSPRGQTWRAHEPYWAERVDLSALDSDVLALELPDVAGRRVADLVEEAAAAAGAHIKHPVSVGHRDCHFDNLLADPAGRIAIIDLELVGPRPGAQLTDLGVLAHRVARVAARAGGATTSAVHAVCHLARGYGADAATMRSALTCAVHESLAKIQACARHGPPGLDGSGRRLIAANHSIYILEKITLMRALDEVTT